MEDLRNELIPLAVAEFEKLMKRERKVIPLPVRWATDFALPVM